MKNEHVNTLNQVGSNLNIRGNDRAKIETVKEYEQWVINNTQFVIYSKTNSAFRNPRQPMTYIQYIL